MAKSNRKQKRTFLAVFLGSEAAMKRWERLSPKAMKEREAAGMASWHAWATKNKKAIVSMGAPLGATKKIDRKGIANTTNQLTAYTVVQAASHAAAAKLFKNHAHFTFFPGESIEIMECLKIPGM